MHFFALAYGILPKGWHSRFFMLIGLYIALGVFEMLGVASIMPFVALLSDPSALGKSSIGKAFGTISPIPLEQLPVHWVGVVVLVLFIAGNLLGLASTWLSIRFAARLGIRLAGDISAGFFAKGYQFIRSESPAVLANYTVREIDRAVSGGILQLCLVVSRSFQVLLVVGVLVFISPLFSAAFAIVSLIMYTIFFRILRTRMNRAGEDILEATGRAVQASAELFGSAKEVMTRGNLTYFIGGVREWLFKYHKADEVSRVFPMVPKYLIELTAFSMLLAVPIYLSWSGADYRSIVPYIALFAYAGYRLLPSIQQVFSSLSILKFNASAIVYLEKNIREATERKQRPMRIPRMSLGITLNAVVYAYPGCDKPALSDVSLRIQRSEKVAIVGISGSGKTTLLDILLGLAVPSSGKLFVDGNECSERRLVWEARAVGYAPQTPLILSASVAENIAFGIVPDTIDSERCRTVAQLALIDDVISALPHGYETKLGGEGTALSGGESQRIAIARALYHSPDIIMLDEPTSALDPNISSRLIGNLCASTFEKTVIVVTHDWDSLPLFDKIVVVDGGHIVSVGMFKDVAGAVEELRRREADTV